MSQRIYIFVTLFLLTGVVLSARAQNANSLIRSGNRFYKKKQIDASLRQYQEAVKKAPDNPSANYNLGNSQFRKNNFGEAAKSFDASVAHSSGDKALQEKGLYNKGVAMVKQQKLQEGIDAWKGALKLDASDEDARENLEKALRELKNKQSQQQKDKKDQQQKEQKDKKDQKDQKKDQDQQQQQPKPQPSRLNRQQVEQLLKALQQKENEIQDKLNQNKVKAANQPEKDW
jgi:tetratricopeptide (TPR) repeat protein